MPNGAERVCLMKKELRAISDIFLAFVGSVIYGVGFSLFFESNGIAPGGISGVAVILSKTAGLLGVGTWVFILNLPILAAGLKKFGVKLVVKTFFVVIISSLVMDGVSSLNINITSDVLLSAVFGALLSGAGIGLVFRSGATTGGVDIIIRILRTKFRHIPSGSLFLIIDVGVIIASAIAFGNITVAMYASLASFVQTRIINAVLYGSDTARLVYIISDNRKIAERLLQDLHTGVTYLSGKGAYTDSEKQVLMCVLPMKSFPYAKDIVRHEDENAFMIVTSASSVFGQGYKQNINEEI